MIDLTKLPYKQEEELNELSIYDVAILLAHIRNKPLLRAGRTDCITVEHIQLACFYSQGQSMAEFNKSLFKEDFYIRNGYIENPEIFYLFGQPNKKVESFIPSTQTISLLTPQKNSFTVASNRMVIKQAYEIFPKDINELLKELKKEEFWKNAELTTDGKISKLDIMNYFKSQGVSRLNTDWSFLEIDKNSKGGLN